MSWAFLDLPTRVKSKRHISNWPNNITQIPIRCVNGCHPCLMLVARTIANLKGWRFKVGSLSLKLALIHFSEFILIHIHRMMKRQLTSSRKPRKPMNV